MDEAPEGGWAPTISRVVEHEPPTLAPELPARANVDHIGRFAILRLLGEGGMGRVYVGYDEQLDRKVAIKLLRGSATSEVAGLRLVREAQALARLSHPNVVQVHEAGTDHDAVFVAMELVDGHTLADWAARTQTDWRARLDALLQAGRGLAAAHAAGLVHRDFKPENVLVGSDGRVRVLDFGLARSSGLADERLERELETTAPDVSANATQDDAKQAGEHESTGGQRMLDADLTVCGTVMGTAAYMAPEQHAGQPCDAAADQFGFCVTAFELLFDRRPFEGAHMRALAHAKRHGEILAIPSDSAVPRVVREAILRGLAVEARARWPDMDALLDALERGVSRPSRRWPKILGAAAIAVFGLGLGLTNDADEPAACELDGEVFAGVWDGPRRRALRDAFARAQVDDDVAREALTHVEHNLDAWSSAWARERQASCRATKIDASQSAAMLDRREACLARQRVEFDAVIRVLISADQDLVTRIGPALETLPDLGGCSIAALDASAHIPLEGAVQAEVEAGFAALAEARAQLRIGRPQLAEQRASEARTIAARLDYTPLALEADAVSAAITIDRGKLDEGLELLRTTALAAARARLFDLEASVRVQLARAAAGDFAHPLLERWMIDEAQLALDRVTRPLDPRAVTLELARARMAEQAGDYSQAIAAHERAHALSEGRLDEAQRAILRIGVGTARYRAGDYQGARAELEDCLASVRQSWGPSAPVGARIEFNLGMIASDLGEPERALAHLESAIDIDTRVWGADSLEVGRDRFALAYVAFAEGQLERACSLTREVERIYTRELGPRHDETAAALTGVGLCQRYDGDYEDALATYARALEIQRELLGDEHYEVGLLLYNIAEVELMRGNIEIARTGFEQAESIFAAKLPDAHPLHAAPLKGLGLVALATGDDEIARDELERALALVDASQLVELAEIRFGLARALVAGAGPHELERARELADAALADFERASLEREANAVRAWLAEISKREDVASR